MEICRLYQDLLKINRGLTSRWPYAKTTAAIQAGVDDLSAYEKDEEGLDAETYAYWVVGLTWLGRKEEALRWALLAARKLVRLPRHEEASALLEEAERLAGVRLFSVPSGAYGTNLDKVIPLSNTWEGEKQVALRDAYYQYRKNLVANGERQGVRPAGPLPTE